MPNLKPTCPRVGLDRVCAQLETDPTKSSGENFNPPPTGVVDWIGRVEASTDVGQIGRG